MIEDHFTPRPFGKFDGKDYPVNWSRTGTSTRAWKRIDDRSYQVINKVDGQVTGTSGSVVSLDGKTLTITSIGNKTVRVVRETVGTQSEHPVATASARQTDRIVSGCTDPTY